MIFQLKRKAALKSLWASRRIVFLVVAIVLSLTTTVVACDCGCGRSEASPLALSDYDFFTNYGEYMPRAHCLQTAEGSPDWPWIATLIVLNVSIIIGYLRIVLFWRRCYLDEKPEDRDRSLKDLAYIFVLCATCGYLLSIVIFFWPVYRLQALLMIGLAFVTWRFATNLEPFRKSFSAHRLQRQLNDALQKDKKELESKHQELTKANLELATTMDELQKTNKDLDEFVYAASHDLRSPLRAIESLSEFVLEDVGDNLPEGSRSDLLQMQGRVRRMDRMLNGLLEYSRMRRLSFQSETFDVSEVLEECATIIDVPAGFQVNLADCSIELISPRPPLEQVLRNLIDNAIKHHDRENGTIDVCVEDAGEFIKFKVTDDGPGIAAENRSRVFEMFQTLSRRDEKDTSGMGLALVQRVVESHGGSVSIIAPEGRGVTFQFTWPKTLTSEQAIKSIEVGNNEEELCHV